MAIALGCGAFFFIGGDAGAGAAVGAGAALLGSRFGGGLCGATRDTAGFFATATTAFRSDVAR